MRNIQPLISVIVPIYNVEEYLDECVESLIKQTYENLEIILVDDGSKDSCPEMCDNWAQKDTRIRVVHKENGGLSSARNAGLDVCTGDYISFIDSDDFISPDTYKIMLDDMNTKQVDVVKCAMCRYRDGQVMEEKHIDVEKQYDTEELLDCYFYHKEDICGGVCDKLYKAELFDTVRFPEGINSEDYYAHVQLYSKMKNMYYNNLSLYYYRMRDNSITRVKEIDAHSYDKITISDMVKEYVDKNLPNRSEDAVAFQALARFAVYYESMFKKHEKKLEKKWRKDLKTYVKHVISSRKMSMGFKIKYIWFSYFSNSYIKFKRLMGSE